MKRPQWVLNLSLIFLVSLFIYKMIPIVRAIADHTFSSIELIEVIWWAIIWGSLIKFGLRRNKSAKEQVMETEGKTEEEE